MYIYHGYNGLYTYMEKNTSMTIPKFIINTVITG
jgi:hypothetical protein